MIVVKADLISAVSDSNNEHLGMMTISNDGTGTASCANYDVKLYSRGKNPRIIRTARLEKWPHNDKTAWDLITAAVKKLDEVKNT